MSVRCQNVGSLRPFEAQAPPPRVGTRLCSPRAGHTRSQDDVPHIFECFYTTKDDMRDSGLGLGLYITKVLVEAHGGNVWVETGRGKGAAFYFTLPIVR